MDKYNSALVLKKIIYDKIEFDRKGFKNDNELKCNLQVQIGMNEEEIFKVTLDLNGEKSEEYDIQIVVSGYFTINHSQDLENDVIRDLINKNSVAILMPYLRSELTLLTAQPDTDSVVLPAFNINKMLSREE